MIDNNLRFLLALAAFASLTCAAKTRGRRRGRGELRGPGASGVAGTTITLARVRRRRCVHPTGSLLGRAFMQPKPIPAAFCRVTGDIRPTQDSDIKFEVWLPVSGWSGRYESVGNGGFAGSIRYDSMLNPLLGGSVVPSTNEGHDGPAIGSASAGGAFGHPEQVIGIGQNAVHLTAVAAKAITAAFYGRQPTHSYFVGCSKVARKVSWKLSATLRTSMASSRRCRESMDGFIFQFHVEHKSQPGISRRFRFLNG